MRNRINPRHDVAGWIILLVIVLLGASLRFAAITSIGLQGSDNTYYTNISNQWSKGDRVYAIGENWTLYRPVVFEVFGQAIRRLGFNDASIKMTNAGLDTVNIALVFLLAFILSRRNLWAASSAAIIYSLLPFTILISRSEQTHILSTSTLLTALILLSLSWTTDNRAFRLTFVVLSGLATGLSALTHEDLIFTAAGPLLLLLFNSPSPAKGIKARLMSAASQTGAYFLGVILIAHKMLLIHQVEAHARASEIVGHRVSRSLYLDFLERPFKFGWNAVTGTGSTVLACLVVILIVILLTRFSLRLKSSRNRWKPATPSLQDLPLWTVAGYLLLFASFFGYFAVRLFVPLIPLVIVWLFVRTASLAAETRWGRGATPFVLAGMTVILVSANIGHFGAIRDFQFDHFNAWTRFSLAADLRPDLGASELRNRLTHQSWARQRFEELQQVVNEDARLLVGASTFHPFPGRRTLQMDYYFGDDAVYLFDHDQPLDQLIADKNITYVLLTTYQTYDRRIVEWTSHQRYRYQGRWGPPEPVVLGASLGFSVGQYTVESEFYRIRAYLAGRGARIILGHGELLKKRPSTFDSPSFVVWTLDTASWPPLEHEIAAISLSHELASAGQLDQALDTLKAAEAGSPALAQLRLKLAQSRILAEFNRPAKACKVLLDTGKLLPKDTTLCTALSEAFPTPSATADASKTFTKLLEIAPKNRALRNLLLGLSVNEADFAIEAEDPVKVIEAFNVIEDHLETPGDHRLDFAVAKWCAGIGRTLIREGRVSEAQASLFAALAGYRRILATIDPPSSGLLLATGRALSDIGRFEESVEVLSKACDASPADPRIWSNLCLALMRVGADERASQACGKALSLDRRDVLASTVTIELLVRKNRWNEASDRAIALLNSAAAKVRHPQSVDRLAAAANDIVAGFVSQGEPLAAAKLSRALGRFLSDRGYHTRAIDVLLDAAGLSPQDADLWAGLCLAQNRAGQTSEALESCLTTLELEQHHVWARLMSAEILASDDRWPDALQQAQSALTILPLDDEYTQTMIEFTRQATDSGYAFEACDLLRAIEGPDAVAGALVSLNCPVLPTAER